MVLSAETLQRLFGEANVSREAVDDKLNRLADAMDRMTERMQPGDASAAILERIATEVKSIHDIGIFPTNVPRVAF